MSYATEKSVTLHATSTDAGVDLTVVDQYGVEASVNETNLVVAFEDVKEVTGTVAISNVTNYNQSTKYAITNNGTAGIDVTNLEALITGYSHLLKTQE